LVGKEVLDLALDAEGLEVVRRLQDGGRRSLVMARGQLIRSLDVFLCLATRCTPPLLTEMLKSAGGRGEVELLLGHPDLVRAVVEGRLEILGIRK
jgi:hypothetical protein